MKERITSITLTQKMKDMSAFHPEELGEELFDRLKDDPNYAMMCMFSRNSGKLMAKKVEYEVPVQGTFRECVLSYDNPMWNWDSFDVIALSVREGYRDNRHRILQAHALFPGSDKLMSSHMCSATLEEIIEFLNAPEFGPKLMKLLDEFNTSMRKHD